MLARDKDLLTHVNDWIAKNTEIAQMQITELQAQRIVIESNAGLVDIPEIKTPDSYHTTFEASHPVANKLLAIAKAVDNELVACEALYFAGVIGDNEYSKLLDQTTTIIRGSVDRIYKATKPGNSEGVRFNPADLAKLIREGNRMMFSDISHEYHFSGPNLKAVDILRYLIVWLLWLQLIKEFENEKFRNDRNYNSTGLSGKWLRYSPRETNTLIPRAECHV